MLDLGYIVYLDHNAATAPDLEILQGVLHILKNSVNASSLHQAGQKASQVVAKSRKQVMKGLNCPKDTQCIFTSSGTEANNLAMKGMSAECQLISTTEHISIINAACNPIHIPVGSTGLIDLGALVDSLERCSGQSCVVSVMLANNETGIVQPIKEIAQIAKKYNAIMHTDAAQAVGRIPVDFAALEVDAMTISGHKFGGTQGCGALLVKDCIKIKPLIEGGPQENYARAGTENVAAIYSIGAASEKIDSLLAHTAHILQLRNYLEDGILDFATDALVIAKNASRISNTSCIVMPGVHKSSQVMYFDMHNIAVSAGPACAHGMLNRSHVLAAMNLPEAINDGAIRVSLGWENTMDEIKFFLQKWKDLYNNREYTIQSVKEALYDQ